MAAPPPREPAEMPHLSGESGEFLALADAEAAVEGVTVPLHSHVLARSSRVLGQLFTSLRESSGGTPGLADKVTCLSDLFAGEGLPTALVCIYLLYNPAPECVREIFELEEWRSESLAGSIPLEPALLQSVVGLADKLDARKLLQEVQALASSEHSKMIRRDHLGWLATGVRLHLGWLRDLALAEIVNTLQSPHRSPAVRLLRDARWKELDGGMLLLLIDALTAFKYCQSAQGLRATIEGWSEMGDLTAACSSAPPSEAPGSAPLDHLEDAQLQQAAADWHGAFDDDGDLEEEDLDEVDGW